MQPQKFNDLETGTLGEGLNRRALLACPTKRYQSLS